METKISKNSKKEVYYYTLESSNGTATRWIATAKRFGSMEKAREAIGKAIADLKAHGLNKYFPIISYIRNNKYDYKSPFNQLDYEHLEGPFQEEWSSGLPLDQSKASGPEEPEYYGVPKGTKRKDKPYWMQFSEKLKKANEEKKKWYHEGELSGDDDRKWQLPPVEITDMICQAKIDWFLNHPDDKEGKSDPIWFGFIPGPKWGARKKWKAQLGKRPWDEDLQAKLRMFKGTIASAKSRATKFPELRQWEDDTDGDNYEDPYLENTSNNDKLLNMDSKTRRAIMKAAGFSDKEIDGVLAGHRISTATDAGSTNLERNDKYVSKEERRKSRDGEFYTFGDILNKKKESQNKEYEYLNLFAEALESEDEFTFPEVKNNYDFPGLEAEEDDPDISEAAGHALKRASFERSIGL
jgi:hypothetical protein